MKQLLVNGDYTLCIGHGATDRDRVVGEEVAAYTARVGHERMVSAERIGRRTFISERPQVFTNRNMADYLGQSPRDVGAGLAAGGVAFLATVLYILWNVVQGFRPRGSPVLFLAMLVTPVVALLVATAVWRVAMPDEPKPVYGAIAGAVAAVVSIFIFTSVIGLMAAITESLGGTVGGSVFEFVSFAGFIALYGGIFTLPAVVPIGASVGYGYEWYLARGQT
jgi:hypothetical protein